MPTPAALTKEDARKAVQALKVTGADINRLFYDGDHWQRGAGWIGPRPEVGEEGFTETMLELERGFISRNVVAEVANRHRAAVVGTEPAWGLTPIRGLEDGEEPTKAEQDLIAEAEAALTTWWNERGIHSWLQKFVITMLLARYSTFRLYVPRGLLTEVTDEGGTRKVAAAPDLASALDMVWPDAPQPLQAAVVTDDDTKDRYGVYVYTRQQQDGTNPEEWVEVVFRERRSRDANTIIRSIGPTTDTSYPIPLGGRLTIYQGDRDLFITEQIRACQKALNLALSTLPRNVVTGGWLERVLLNAQMPGDWEYDPETGDRIPGSFTPTHYATGSGTTNFVRGIDVESVTSQGDRTIELANPDVRWRDPVDVKPSVEAKEAHYRDILDEADQAHVLMNSEATTSGYSREQARADFESSVGDTLAVVEGAGRWLLETALAMAEAFMGQAGQFTSQLRVDFNCRVDLGPISPDEKRANDEAVKSGSLSLETAMSRNGVNDVDAELQRMMRQPGAMIQMWTRIGEALTNLTSAGLDLATAAELLDLDPEDLALIKKAAAVPPPDDGTPGVDEELQG